MSELRWILLGCGMVLLFGIFLWGKRSRGQAAGVDDVETQGRIDPPFMQQAPPAPQPFANAGHAEQPVASRWHEDEWTSTVTDLPEMRFDVAGTFDDPLEPTLDELILPSEAEEESPANFEHVSAPVLEVPVATAAATPRPRAVEKKKIVAFRLSSSATRFDGARLHAALAAAGLTHGKYGIFHRLHDNGASVLSVASMVEPGAFDLATMGDTQFAGVTIFSLLPGPVPAGQAYDQLLECARQLEQALGGVLHDDRGMPLTAQRVASLRDEVLDFEHLLG